MLTICRSLLGNPRVILIDEPTEGLAPKIVSAVGECIKDMQRRGVSVVLVEQKLAIALKVSTRVCVMGRGRIVFEGHPQQMIEDRTTARRLAGGLGIHQETCDSKEFQSWQNLTKSSFRARSPGPCTPRACRPTCPLPLTRLREQAIEAAQAGAAILHLHARNPVDGKPTPDPQRVRSIRAAHQGGDRCRDQHHNRRQHAHDRAKSAWPTRCRRSRRCVRSTWGR